MSAPPSPSATPPKDSTASPSREAPPNDSTASPSGEPPPNDSAASPSGEAPSEEQCGWMSMCLFLLFMLVVIVAFVTLLVFAVDDLISKSPRFYLSDLRGPPLDANPSSAVTVCEFTIRNRARLYVINYRKFDITLRHPSGREVAGTIPAFTQGFHRKTTQEVSLQFGNDTPVAPLPNRSGAAVFRVFLQTRYRYEGSGAKGARYKGRYTRERLRGDVEVNREGRMTSTERILLVSAGAPGVASTGWLAVLALVGSLIFIV